MARYIGRNSWGILFGEAKYRLLRCKGEAHAQEKPHLGIGIEMLFNVSPEIYGFEDGLLNP